jgi:TolA-binding protein
MKVLVVAIALVVSIAGPISAQQPQQPPQSCEQQLQSTTQYALIVKGARDQAEFSIADLRKQVAELTQKLGELEKRVSSAPVAPKP